MAKIKAWYRSVPIWLAIFLYAAAALAVTSLLSNRITSLAYSRMAGIQVSYVLLSPGSHAPASEHNFTFYTVDTDGVTIQAASEEGSDQTSTWIATLGKMDDADARLFKALQLCTQWAPFFVYSLLLLAAALLFYFTKVKTPLDLLETASAKIADSELDFSVEYEGRDEMAKL